MARQQLIEPAAAQTVRGPFWSETLPAAGYFAGWWEVFTHFLQIPLGGRVHVVTAMNTGKWTSLITKNEETIPYTNHG